MQCSGTSLLHGRVGIPRTSNSIYLWLYSPLFDLGRSSVSRSFYTVGRTPWTGDQSVARPLPTHRTAQTQNKRTHTTMPQVAFEPTISVFERAKIFHALVREATVIGLELLTIPQINSAWRYKFNLIILDIKLCIDGLVCWGAEVCKPVADSYTESGVGSYIFWLKHSTKKCSWLRHYATSRKVAGSSSDEVIGVFQLT
jgi:hypothetical protein